jgi:transposase-like protein
MIRRRYTDEERSLALAALAANAGSVERTAEQLGIPKDTLANWASGRRHPEAVLLAADKKAPLADRLEQLAHVLLDDLARPERRKTASLQQLATTFAIAVDKMRLLREQPTMIPGPMTDPRRMTDAELRAEIENLRRERAGPPAGTGPAGSDAPVAPPAGPLAGPAAPPEAGGPEPGR